MNRGNLYVAAAVLVLGGICAVAAKFSWGANPAMSGATTTSTTTGPASSAAASFRKNVKVEVDGKFMVVHCDGIPDHTTGDFPNRSNPNKILKQDYTFKIPLSPQKSEKITKLPMGPIGVAVNGVPFYNPYNAEGQDAAKNEVFDECCGHPDQLGRYHYHIYPKCVHGSFESTEKKDEGAVHSALIGYAFDGFGIYGPNGEKGKPPTDLDECNGHEDKERGYHYHVTGKFPYILGGYHGVVEQSNMDRGGRDPGGRPVGPPPGPPPF